MKTYVVVSEQSGPRVHEYNGTPEELLSLLSYRGRVKVYEATLLGWFEAEQTTKVTKIDAKPTKPDSPHALKK